MKEDLHLLAQSLLKSLITLGLCIAFVIILAEQCNW